MNLSKSRWNMCRQAISLAMLGIVFIAMSVRQYRFVDRYAVNVMFGDQWDIYAPFEPRETLWQQFDHQHGPHRQGVGGVINHVLAEWGYWNSRWDAFGINFILIAAAGCALLLAHCCGVRRPLAMLPIPLLYLSRRQWEDFVCASNISHGAMPILLFTLYCLACFVQSNLARLTLVSILTFFLIFTGFGIFVGLVTPIVLLVEEIQACRIKEWGRAGMVTAAMLACGISWWMFSWNYVFNPAAPGFRFPYEKPVEYFDFVAVMLSNLYGLTIHNPLVVPFGLFVMVCLVVLCMIHGWRLLRGGAVNNRASTVIFCLATYALIYCFDTAVGRVCMGWRTQAVSSRYVTLMIPAGLAIYLHLVTLRSARASLTLAIFYALAIMPGAIYLEKDAADFIHSFHDRRLAWGKVYRATHNRQETDAIVGLGISDDDPTALTASCITLKCIG
jgi:hypothetical protein